MDISILFYNLSESNNLSNRVIKKVIDSGITINNIKNMTIAEFANLYGVAKIDLYNTLKAFANSNCVYKANEHIELLHISINALYHFNLSDKILAKLVESRYKSIYDVLLTPKDIIQEETGLGDSSISKVITAANDIDINITLENLEVATRIQKLEDNPKFLDLFKNEILSLLNANGGNFISKDDLNSRLPLCFKLSSKLNTVILELEHENKIENSDCGLKRHLYNLVEYIDAQPDSKQKNFMIEYLNGKTLEEIAKPFNLTRERIRQILTKFKFETIKEDEYLKYYSEYYLSEDLFIKLFDSNSLAYRYCQYKTKKMGTKPYREMLNDDSIPENIKNRIIEIDNLFVYIDGNKLYKTMSDILRYYLKNNVLEPTKEKIIISDFMSYWEKTIGEKFNFTTRALEHCLDKFKYVILSDSRTWRYYEYSDDLLSELIEELNLKQYDGLEISTKVIFENNVRLMRDYDIRNHYELHSILKKSGILDNVVTFGRVPMIKIGIADRNLQILDLIMDLSPVSTEVLVSEYCKLYGTEAKSTLAYISTNFADMYYNGSYHLNLKEPSNEEIECWKKILTKDFYMNEDIVKLANENNLSFDKTYLRNSVTSKLGYKSNTTYIVSSKYKGANEYFSTLLKDDIIDLNNIDIRIHYIIAFNEVLYEKLRNKEYFEYSPRKFISIKKLNSMGVKLEDIDRFIDKALKFAKNGTIFNIKSMKNSGFNDELLNYDFEDMFYSSLLRTSNKLLFRRISSGACLFKIQVDNYLLTISKLLEEILFKFQKIGLIDLGNYLEQQYGLIIDKYKVKEYIKDTNLYFDESENTVWLNYELFSKK